MTRKHKGIIQDGKNKGRLKKGYFFTGEKTKTGLPIIKQTGGFLGFEVVRQATRPLTRQAIATARKLVRPLTGQAPSVAKQLTRRPDNLLSNVTVRIPIPLNQVANRGVTGLGQIGNRIHTGVTGFGPIGNRIHTGVTGLGSFVSGVGAAVTAGLALTSRVFSNEVKQNIIKSAEDTIIKELLSKHNILITSDFYNNFYKFSNSFVDNLKGLIEFIFENHDQGLESAINDLHTLPNNPKDLITTLLKISKKLINEYIDTKANESAQDHQPQLRYYNKEPLSESETQLYNKLHQFYDMKTISSLNDTQFKTISDIIIDKYVGHIDDIDDINLIK